MRLFLIILSVALATGQLLDIAQNVCEFGDENQLKCYMRTLQSDINQADVLGDIEKLTIVCSDAFFYESILRPQHLGRRGNLVQLQLEYCKIRDIPRQAFEGLDHLLQLTINSHNSEWSSINLDLNKDSFAGLESLQKLDLSFNNIWSLPKFSLSKMSSLKVLNLSYNHLLEVSDLGLEEASPLEEIDLSGNFISTLRSQDLKAYNSVKKFNLAKNRLTHIYDDALEDIGSTLQVLDMSDNKLAALPPVVFNKSGQLQELHLQNNSLTLVTPELFAGLSNLQLLNLSHNAIDSHLLSTDTFGGLTNLKVLDLSHNKMADLDPALFAPLTNLQHLILDANNIRAFKAALPHLPNLEKLSIASNGLETFNGAILHSLNLTRLDLSSNNLRSLTDLNLANLEDISLSSNKLDSIPDLSACPKLKSVDLGENHISQIPEGIFAAQLQTLYALRLSGNNIRAVSNTTFGNMSNLHMLNLASNQLKEIPQGTFDGLSQLRGLRLDNNALVDLNGIVAFLGRLQWLNVSANSLEWFDYAFIPKSLEWLDISHNEVGVLGNYYHQQNFNLHTLEAGHNKITAIDESALPAKKLQFVQLQHNNITQVAPHTFSQLAYLNTADLRYNSLQTLSKASLRKSIQVLSIASAPKVLLRGNPLVCDCHLEWLPSINDYVFLEDKHDDHVRVGDLSDLECQLTTEEKQVGLVTQVPSGAFLCSYTTHCFDLCRCCDYFACDCRMQCPSGCTCQHDATWSRNIIKCSAANHTNIPILIPMDATQLYLDGNDFNAGLIDQQHFLGRQRLQALYLNNSGVTTIGSSAFTGLTSLQVLDLSYNPMLRQLNGYEFAGSGLMDLQELRLDHCGLTAINPLTFDPLINLKVLRLDGNLLTAFPVWQLNNGIQLLSLAQNLWSCHCDFIAPFNEFLQTNIEKVIDYEEVQCVSENVMTPNKHQLCQEKQAINKAEEVDTQYELAAILIPTIIVSAAVIIIGLLAVCVFKKHISKWLYSKSSEVYESRYGGGGSSLSTSATATSTTCQANLFDLYISYAKTDADFVDHNLAPTLEHGPRAATYRLCLHHRDFPSLEYGESVNDTVSLAAESSAKMLIVLSKAYLAHEWPLVKSAILNNLQKNPGEADRLILLSIDDVSDSELILAAPELLKHVQNTVKWGSSGFISKLRFFLPEPVHATFQRTVTLRSIQQQQQFYAPQQSEHLYYYIAENPYHTLEPKLMPNPQMVFTVQPPQQSFDNPVMTNRQFNNVCHSHSLSTSSGQRLLTNNPEEYIV